MKTLNHRHQMEASKPADDYRRAVLGGRIIIYSEFPSDKSMRFWLCFQHATPPGILRPYTVSGQLYLEKDGHWREPHGAKYRRHFSTPATAMNHADNLNFAQP